jgi:hypothetical protein
MRAAQTRFIRQWATIIAGGTSYFLAAAMTSSVHCLRTCFGGRTAAFVVEDFTPIGDSAFLTHPQQQIAPVSLGCRWWHHARHEPAF